MTVLVGCPEPDCDLPAEVLDSYYEYYPVGEVSLAHPIPMARVLHVRSRCLAGHILDSIEEEPKGGDQDGNSEEGAG
jgi:hypothetical protein